MSQGRSGNRQIRQMNSAAVATAEVATAPRTARSTDRTWLERLRAVIGLNGQIVWVADADGNIRDQLGFSAYTGLRPEACLGRKWLTAIHPQDRMSAAALWTRAVAERTRYENELRVLGADGEYRPFLVRAEPIFDAAGTVREWVGSYTDLTEPLRRAGAHEDHLEQQRLTREAAERDSVLDVVAHELRNPLTGIKTVLQMTLRHLENEEPVSPSQLESLARSVRRMEALVQDMLGAARLKGERQQLTLTRRDLRELCRHVVQDQRLATGRDVTLSLPRKPAVSNVDTNRMTRVLSNLISNAHKYSPADTPIAVRLTIRGSYGRIAVIDDGPGIPLHAQEHLFQRFYRVPGIEAVHDGDGGLGLGLAICRELVEQHNGHIGVESLPGRGSTFWVTVPLVDPA
jgi:PAS domain S-box-containing protein